MIYRLLNLEEKEAVLRKLREINHLEHLIPPDADMETVCRRMAKVKVVGAFDDAGNIAFVYWTYRADAELKRRCIAVGALDRITGVMLREMRRCVEYLTQEWELWGEIDADNPRGVHLGELCGFTVAGVRDSKIIVKHERST